MLFQMPPHCLRGLEALTDSAMFADRHLFASLGETTGVVYFLRQAAHVEHTCIMASTRLLCLSVKNSPRPDPSR